MINHCLICCAVGALCLGLVLFSVREDCYSSVLEGNLYRVDRTYSKVKNGNARPQTYSGCQPMQIFGVIRHGTRTAGKKYLDNLKDLVSLRDEIVNATGGLCEDERARLTAWKPVLFDGEKHLTHEGEDEMLELAERIKNRFPSLFTGSYSPERFEFRFTDTQRTRESSKYFTIGLFGRLEASRVIYPEPIYKDPILRFYKLCKKWEKTVKKNPETKKEVKAFENHGDMFQTRQKITERLGLKEVISTHLLTTMYTVCAFETAWDKKKSSAWCSLFDKDDLENLEYHEDIESYWKHGYGNDINHAQACPLVKKILSSFNETGTAKPVVFYFTHSGALVKLLAHLNLYKDKFALTHDLPQNLRNSRVWRLSYIDTFGTNLIFVHFKCEGGESKVLTLHQERPVIIPGCDSELCPLSTLLTKFKGLINCDFNGMCSM